MKYSAEKINHRWDRYVNRVKNIIEITDLDFFMDDQYQDQITAGKIFREKYLSDSFDNLVPYPIKMDYFSKSKKKCLYNFFCSNYLLTKPTISKINKTTICHYYNYKKDLVFSISTPQIRLSSNNIDFVELIQNCKTKSKSIKINKDLYMIFNEVKFHVYYLIKSTPNLLLKNVQLSGYNMGGSLALIISLFIKALFPKLSITCTIFGSPIKQLGNKLLYDMCHDCIDQLHVIYDVDDLIIIDDRFNNKRILLMYDSQNKTTSITHNHNRLSENRRKSTEKNQQSLANYIKLITRIKVKENNTLEEYISPEYIAKNLNGDCVEL